jgi:uncharacterized protein YaiL (DUF2058 family)
MGITELKIQFRREPQRKIIEDRRVGSLSGDMVRVFTNNQRVPQIITEEKMEGRRVGTLSGAIVRVLTNHHRKISFSSS